MTWVELSVHLKKILGETGWEADTDEDGQVIIYTGLVEAKDGRLLTFDQAEKEGV